MELTPIIVLKRLCVVPHPLEPSPSYLFKQSFLKRLSLQIKYFIKNIRTYFASPQLSHTHRNTASPCLSPPLFTGAHLREGVPRHLEPWLCSLASGFRAPAPAFPRLANRQKQNLCRAGMDQTDCNPEALCPCCHQGPLITTPLPQPRLSNESSPIRANTLPVYRTHE